MLLMFQLGRADVWPVADFGVRNGFRLAYGLKHLPTPRALHEFGERWRPHRSAAAWYLWRAVDLHRDGKLPPPLRPAPRIAMHVPRVPDAAPKSKKGATTATARKRAMAKPARSTPPIKRASAAKRTRAASKRGRAASKK
jgi:hypothetical protein